MKSTKKTPRKGRRFATASGAPFSDDDAQIIGRELQKIADANLVEDIRSLDKHLVFDIVESDLTHPLRAFYNWDLKEAARKHWIDQTAKIIRSVRIITMSIGTRTKYAPMFVSAEVPDRKGGVSRAHVIREDALASNPVFMSAIGSQIRRIRTALDYLEQFIASGDPPKEVLLLKKNLREAFHRYEASIAVEAAE